MAGAGTDLGLREIANALIEERISPEMSVWLR
jgi:hypothetical protein